APAGTHIAILVKLIDLGWHDSTFAGEIRRQHQALLVWELSNKLNSAGRPFLVSKTMNLSLHEKATFRSWAESMAGRTFGQKDLYGRDRIRVETLLGCGCMLKVEHVERDDGLSARVANLIPVPEGIPAPRRFNDLVFFSLDPAEFDPAVFDTLSPWAKAKIEATEGFSNVIATGPEGRARHRRSAQGNGAGRIT